MLELKEKRDIINKMQTVRDDFLRANEICYEHSIWCGYS